VSVGSRTAKAGAVVPTQADAAAPPARGFAVGLGVVLALGVVIRVLYTVLVAPWNSKVFDDQFYYHFEPALLAHGRGFIEPVFASIGRVVPTAEHAPFYPVVLAGLAKLGGTGEVIQRLAGTVFGAGTIAAVGLLGRRFAGDRAGLLAAGIAAVYPILITADGALMSESLYGLLVALSLLAAYRLLDAPSPRRGVVLGGLVGLAALTRGEGALLLVLLLIPLVRRPRGARMAAVACATFLIVLAPWTVRNWVVFGRFVPVSTDTGAVIGGANCDQTYYGPNIGAWDYLCNQPSPGNEADESAREQSIGLHYASHHLRRLPIVVLARLERVWGFRQPMQTNSGRSPWAQNMGTIMYYLLLAPAVYGFLLLRRRRAPTWVLMSPVVLVTVTAAVGYGFLRFREPAEITLVVLAGITIDELLRRFIRRRRGRLVGRGSPSPQSAA
jgi:4-amino-4-deoxy-L-arabinose transferase-like glycosyltransferase